MVPLGQHAGVGLTAEWFQDTSARNLVRGRGKHSLISRPELAGSDDIGTNHIPALA